MKYSELISFKPIESTIQLLETAEKSAARDAVSTYVMSDSMAEGMQAPVIDQLQMEDVVDNKAIMVVGNFGTGKSHLMSVIAAVATDAENLNYLQNKKFAASMEISAGKFEVLRMKVDGLTMPMREIIMGEIEDDFSNRGIDYEVPDLYSVRDNSRIIKDAMAKFQENPELKSVPVMVLTAEQEAELEYLKMGATDFIRKPFPDIEIVKARISRCIALSEMH
jgi:CheY-like chemotaxis protein